MQLRNGLAVRRSHSVVLIRLIREWGQLSRGILTNHQPQHPRNSSVSIDTKVSRGLTTAPFRPSVSILGGNTTLFTYDAIMAPSVPHNETPAEGVSVTESLTLNNAINHGELLVKPLKYTGSLDDLSYFDVTPVIGREFPEVQLTDILKDDNKIRDLGITSEKPL